MRDLAKTIIFEFPYYLKEQDVIYWASVSRWFETEAVMLSLGLDARRTGDVHVNNSIASKLESEFIERANLLEEALEDAWGDDYRYSSLEPLYDPEKFVKWAKQNFPSFPEDLYQAVLTGKKPAKSGQKSPKNSKNVAAADARWALKREIVAKAESYVRDALKVGCKYCDHSQLAEYMFENAEENNGKPLFDYPKVREETLKKYLIEGAKNALVDSPNRIVGNKGYKKSEACCDIHPSRR